MRQELIEIYDETSNVAVLRAPGRHFPGSLVPGDSLSVLCSLSASISRRLQAGDADDEALLDEAQRLQTLLLQRLLHYQATLDAHGIRLPYTPRASADDLVALLPKAAAPDLIGD